MNDATERDKLISALAGARWSSVDARAVDWSLAATEQLRGSRFIEVMQDNTLSGTTADGAAYNLYFLPGGELTYDDAAGARDRGRWSMDSDGDVCISFETIDSGRSQCYRVELDGRETHGTKQAFESDRLRDRHLLVEGWRVARVTWKQLQGEPGKVAVDLRRALEPVG